MKLRYFSFSAIALFLLVTASAQTDFNHINWREIDSSLISNKNLSSLNSKIGIIQQEAIAANDQAIIGRTLYYQLSIADKKTEDTLFFKNSLFIDSILNSSQSPPLLKAIMHVLKAKRINYYIDHFLYQANKNNVKDYDSTINYQSLSKGQLDSLVDVHFKKAIQISRQLKNVSIEKLLWLSSDPFSILFKPDLADILFFEQIISAHAIPTNQVKSPTWLGYSQGEFIDSDSLEGLSVPGKRVFEFYKNWAAYHRSGSPGSSYFIETLARKFFYGNLSEDSLSKAAYERYLERLVTSPYSEVKVAGVYQLCLLWNSRAVYYNPNSQKENVNYRYVSENFNENYRFDYCRAIKIYNENRSVIDSFPYIHKTLAAIKGKIELPSLSIKMDRSQSPGKPILASLKYRNVSRLFYRVIKIKHTDTLDMVDRINVSRFLRQPFILEKTAPLKLPDDYQWHNAFFKFDSLAPGRYVILYSDTLISDKNIHIGFMHLNVTNIAVVNNDSWVFVLDRMTGFPMEGAKVTPLYEIFSKSTGVRLAKYDTGATKRVNRSGYVSFDVEYPSFVQVYYKGDSLRASVNEPDATVPDELYDKEEYDDLMEYYEDIVQLHFFTDRAIYRPGQTVFYKGIFLVRNPKTGEMLALNWHNLKFPIFKKLLLKLMVKFSKQKIELGISDPFGKTVDSLKILPNKYGSFSGSYRLSKNAPTGKWDFESDVIDADGENDGSFEVEDYKRPSFELTIEKPTIELNLSDSVPVTIRVKSFAGADLNNVRIRYSVGVSRHLPPNSQIGTENYTTMYREILLKGEALTDDNGKFQFTIVDSVLKKYDFRGDDEWSVNYEIEAEAIDETGESQEASRNIRLSTKPVTITIPLPAMVERAELSPIYISAKSDFSGSINKMVEVKIFKIPVEEHSRVNNAGPDADIWLEPKENFKRWFPETDFGDEKDRDRELIFQTSLMAGGDKLLDFPMELIQSGNYVMEIKCRENGRLVGERTKNFSVFDKKSGTFDNATNSFQFMKSNLVEKGKKISWLTGNKGKNIFAIYHLAYFKKGNKSSRVQYVYDLKAEKSGINEWNYTMPVDAIGGVRLAHLYILNNHLYKSEEKVYAAEGENSSPEIIVEQYRKTVVPGGKERFAVSVKTKNLNTASELMTTMYDESLDQLADHKWDLPKSEFRFVLDNDWSDNISDEIDDQLYPVQFEKLNLNDYRGSSVWWANEAVDSLQYFYTSGLVIKDFLGVALSGRVAGMSVLATDGLNDVVVVGYGTVKAKNVTGSSVVIRGTATLSNYKTALIIVDGIIYEGDINTFNTASITDGIVLKGADAVALYGSRAHNGVVILSTKGPVNLAEIKPAPAPVAIRRNFSESAFFYPSVYAGKDGYYSIKFTLPETVTKWKWKMLAHTKRGSFAYAERSIYTQLNLMVQPDMPRFLYQGDKIVLKSRVTNMDSANINALMKCVVEDAVTNEDITAALVKNSTHSISVASSSNSVGAFTLTVPANLLHPIRIRISAASDNFSDGEEHIIPILSKKVLVSQQVPVSWDKSSTLSISTPEMPADATPYGMEMYINPRAQSAMINSLTYLANYPYGCAEQTFNKMLANMVAKKIFQNDTAVQQALKLSGIATAPVADDSVAGQVSEEAMPWLRLSNYNRIQQQQLNKLFDTTYATMQIEIYNSDLKGMQNQDGGVCWFKGGPSSNYISNYLLAGFGKLRNDGMISIGAVGKKDNYSEFIKRVIDYCDQQFNAPFGMINNLDYLYARSYWANIFPLSSMTRFKMDSVLREYWKDPSRYSLGRKGKLITATVALSSGEGQFHEMAMEEIESIRQAAINDEEGIRWKSYSDEDDLNTSSEEWIVKIAEAFEETGKSNESIGGIIRWLLSSRSGHRWATTKATGEVISLLNRQKPEVIGKPQILTADISGKKVEVTDDLFNGKQSSFIQLDGSGFPKSIAIERSDPSAKTGAGINYYYFTESPKVDPGAASVKLSKTFFLYNDSTKKWNELSGVMKLKIADKIKVVMTFDCPRQLEYVFINDNRAATFEPTNPGSGYEYSVGISYYKSVRDQSIQFFAERIPSGISSISYEMIVAKQGSFSSGVTSLEAMYQPALKLYCGGVGVEVD